MNGSAGRWSATAVVGYAFLSLSVPARAQGIEVTPANIEMAPGQTAAALTVVNRNDRKISFQIRGFSWQQDKAGNDILTPSTEILSSPPLATIQPGAIQVVRLVLRHPPQGREGTYRILFDQLPPPAVAGVVHVLLRISIPVFAEPGEVRIAPRVRWRITRDAGR